MGITLREIIYDIGGGIPGDRAFKAVQTGGPSGGCLPKEMLDLPIDYQSLAQAGLDHGLGRHDRHGREDLHGRYRQVLPQFPPRRILREMRFLPGRHAADVGDRQEDHRRRRRPWRTSPCSKSWPARSRTPPSAGSGQTAANPVLSTLQYFRAEYEKHVVEKRCPAMVCKEIVSSPCQYICPIGQEASTYIALIAQKKFEEAYRGHPQGQPAALGLRPGLQPGLRDRLPGRGDRRADLHPRAEAVRHGLGQGERARFARQVPGDQGRRRSPSSAPARPG